MREILVITDVPDPHVDLVEAHLKDTVFTVFDTSLFPSLTDITYEMSTEHDYFSIVSQSRDFQKVNGVWFRKPKYLNPKMLKSLKVPTDYHDFIIANHIAAVTALYDLLDNKFWISRYRNLERASNKIFQLQVAKIAGFVLPKTLVTSSPAAVESFRLRHGDIATKSVHMPVVKIKDRNHMFPTTKIRATDTLDLSGLGLAPAIFQEVILKDVDLRVTVVGEKVFACAINRTSKSDDIDYRTGITSTDLEYEQYELPYDISERCVNMLKLLGLEFGAFDFILDRQGRHVFIEVNPNGQWGWIEEHANLPIAHAIATLLETC